MKTQTRIDILSIDIGTNDLTQSPVSVVLERVHKFMELLQLWEIYPREIIFCSVLQRTLINREGQVPVNTFNHRVKRFNRGMARKFKVYPQARINLPKYIVDGVHLTERGWQIYCINLRQMILLCARSIELG
jgi:hypothetical protein